MMFGDDELGQGILIRKLPAYREEQHRILQNGLEQVAEYPKKQRLFPIQRA